jgi:hypothetical protein
VTEILEHTQKYDNNDEIISNPEFETPERARIRIIGEAIAARTIELDLRHDNSFKQSKTPETFTD